jgi:N-acetylmuramoyl-L-alanine amidase/chitodextrinase
MQHRSHWSRLAIPLLLCLLLAGVANAGTVVFLDQQGNLIATEDPAVTTPESALHALVAGPPAMRGGITLSSAIPAGTKLQRLTAEGQSATVDFSSQISSGLDEVALEAIFKQVSLTLRQFGLDEVKMTADGRELYTYLPPAPEIQPRLAALQAPLTSGSLSGHSITLSPGHGIFWNGAGWYTQRPAYCAPLSEEDFHNLDHAIYLTSLLEADGILVKKVRCQDKNFGTYNGFEWWKMASPYWLQNQGYPCSVYASATGDCTLGAGATEANDDVRARPLASDYDNTNIYLALHTNGSAGNCYGGACATGTDTYYDCSSEHAPWCSVSTSLANAIHPSLISAIRNEVGDSGWVDRGQHDSAGAYGEIRIPDRAAILIELGFHDSCDLDALKLQDHFWTSGAMWGIYRGICTYFGTTPTWGFYSSEYVSDTIPATMAPGEVRQVAVTLRDRGVVWSDAKAFRLGAAGDSDPFTATTRQAIAGEVAPGQAYTWTFTLTAPMTPGDYITDWQMVRDGVAWFGATVTKTINVGGAPDTEPPTVPTNLVGTPVSPTQVNLSWSPSTDNSGVAGYYIYRNSVGIGSSTTTSYSDSTCSSNTTYTYEVSAYDAALNESAKSAPAVVTTPVVSDIVIDNVSATFGGTWFTGTSSVDKYGADYRYATSTATETATATFTPTLEAAGTYDVYCWYPQGANRSAMAPYTVYWNGGSQTVPMNQQANGGRWNLLVAAKPFLAGASGYVKIGNGTGETALNVMADAVRFLLITQADTQAPTVPTNLTATPVSPTQVNLAWTASTDNVGVTGYKIYRNSAQIGTSATTSYSDTTCSPNTTYTYTVSAYDAAGNESAQSAPAVATTPPGASTKNYAPTAITLTRGTITSGAVANLSANDASYLVLTAAKVGSTRYVDWYSNVSIAEPRASVTKLTITLDGKLSASLNQKLYLWNFSTLVWDQVDSRTVGTTDVTVTWNTTSPLNYISSTGEIRLRQYVTRTTSFTSSTDWVKFNIEY